MMLNWCVSADLNAFFALAVETNRGLQMHARVKVRAKVISVKKLSD